jgi:hypothetical protein
MSFAHWDKLLYGIERGECILFLGPELPAVTAEGPRQVPATRSSAARSKKTTVDRSVYRS